MTKGFDEARAALARGEDARLQRWPQHDPNQYGTPRLRVLEIVLLRARFVEPGMELPHSSYEISPEEADELASMSNVIDERGGVASQHDMERLYAEGAGVEVGFLLDNPTNLLSLQNKVGPHTHASNKDTLAAIGKKLQLRISAEQADELVRRGAKDRR